MRPFLQTGKFLAIVVFLFSVYLASGTYNAFVDLDGVVTDLPLVGTFTKIMSLSAICNATTSFSWQIDLNSLMREARRGGAEVAGWTLDRKIRVRFPAYPHRVWALWWQGGKRRLRKSRYPCRGRLGTLKTPSCPWRWTPGSRSKFGNWTTVPSLYIAEISLNVSLNHNQLNSTNERMQPFSRNFRIRL